MHGHICQDARSGHMNVKFYRSIFSCTDFLIPNSRQSSDYVNSYFYYKLSSSISAGCLL
jgi:hypothetical protein